MKQDEALQLLLTRLAALDARKESAKKDTPAWLDAHREGKALRLVLEASGWLPLGWKGSSVG